MTGQLDDLFADTGIDWGADDDPFADRPSPRSTGERDAALVLRRDRIRRPDPDEQGLLQQEADAEIAAMEATLRQVEQEGAESFIARRYRENARVDRVTVTDYYVCLVFEHHEAQKAFLEQLPERVHRVGWFIDGHAVADLLGIPVPPPLGSWPQVSIDATWDAFVDPEELAAFGIDEEVQE